MSQKNKRRSDLKIDPSSPQAISIPREGEKATEVQSQATKVTVEDTGGVTWQPMFVLAMIVLGVLVLLAKALGLF
jgi:hypothetical protein